MHSTDIVFRRDAETLVATPLLRRLTGAPAERPMWQSFEDAVGPSPPRTVILDCLHVQHCFSVGIGQLVALATRCRRAGARFVVRNACPSLVEVFRVLRLDALLDLDRETDGSGGHGPCR